MALFAYCKIQYQTVYVDGFDGVGTNTDLENIDFITGDLGSPSTFATNGLAVTGAAGTTLTTNESGGATLLEVTSEVGISVGEFVAIELDVAEAFGTHFWAKVVATAAGSITINTGLPSAASIGQQVVSVSQLAATTSFTVFEDFKNVKADGIIARTTHLRTHTFSYLNRDFTAKAESLSDIDAAVSSHIDASKYSVQDAIGEAYTFVDKDDAAALQDLAKEFNSTLVTGQSSLLVSISNAINSQAAMDAIVDSRTVPIPSGGGTSNPPLLYDVATKDSYGMVAGSPTATAAFEFRNSGGTRQANINYDHNANEFIIEMRNAGDFIVRHFLAGMSITFTTGNILFSAAATNAATPFTFTNSGLNGGNFRIGAGTVTPEGAVTNTGAGLYVLEDGTDSDIFFKTTASGNTGWVSLLNNTVEEITSDSAVSAECDHARIDASAAIRTATLPLASATRQGKIISFKLSAISSTFYGDIALSGSDTINGSTVNRRLGALHDTFTIIRVGTTSWDILNTRRQATAEMSRTGGTLAQGSVGSTPLVITAFDNNAVSTNGVIAADQANNEFDITHVEGASDTYVFVASLSLEFANNVDALLEVYVNAVATGIQAQFNGTGAGDAHNIALSGSFVVTTAGHDVDVRISAPSGGSNTATWISAHATTVRQ